MPLAQATLDALDALVAAERVPPELAADAEEAAETSAGRAVLLACLRAALPDYVVWLQPALQYDGVWTWRALACPLSGDGEGMWDGGEASDELGAVEAGLQAAAA